MAKVIWEHKSTVVLILLLGGALPFHYKIVHKKTEYSGVALNIVKACFMFSFMPKALHSCTVYAYIKNIV